MKTWKTISLLLGFLVFGSLATFGLESGAVAAPEAAGAGAMAFGCICWLAIVGGALAFQIGCAYFIYSDASKNGIENAVLWALLGFFTTWVGLLIYFLVIKKQHMDKMGK